MPDNSVIVLLINDDARAVRAEYEPDGSTSILKTLDPSIKVGDMVVVESGTRHFQTVAKITDIDIDINYDTQRDVKWVIQKIDTDRFAELRKQEEAAIAAVHSAERRRKKEELRNSLFADHQDKIQALELAKTEESVTEE